MTRAPFQVTVFPYRYLADGTLEYAVFFRRTLRYGDFWQPVAGGGEDDETPLEAAKREANEEAGIDPGAEYLVLDSLATIPAPQAAGMLWGPRVLVVPEYAFGVNAADTEIRISDEHEDYRWVEYDDAHKLLRFDSNQNALWELNFRLTGTSKPI